MDIPPLFYRIHQLLMGWHKKREIHESFYDGKWHTFMFSVRWNEETKEIEIDAPVLKPRMELVANPFIDSYMGAVPGSDWNDWTETC